MGRWQADVLGLAIGFVIGGAAILWIGPALGLSSLASLVNRHTQAEARPAPEPPHPPPQVIRPTAAAATPAIVHPGGSTASSDRHMVKLPAVIRPTETRPGTGVSGTGFFIATDGTLMTAAHVVTGCARTQIASPRVGLTNAQVLAMDRAEDIALLRAPTVRPPATLALGAPGQSPGRFFILGYPSSRANLSVPEETWGTLENQQLPVLQRAISDASETVWVHADAVTHGYSGGPILDPRTGKVAGIVRAGLDPGYLRLIRGMPPNGMMIGPGAHTLSRFLRRAAPDLDPAFEQVVGSNPIDTARRATVHVLCWR